MLTFAMTLQFRTPYIGDPYWPEMYRLIEITKLSGMNRARATQNARRALEEHLKTIGMTLADYETLKQRAARPFHTRSTGEIIIPADQFLSFLVATCDTARAAQRPCLPNEVRSRFVATDLVTDRTAQDGVWSRFATVSQGAGKKLSNQRGLRENAYIAEFQARGEITFDPQFVRPEIVAQAIRWGGDTVGIGASRKMGKGRFTLTRWETISAKEAA